jgi:NitT/TauT family transport system permease protein
VARAGVEVARQSAVSDGARAGAEEALWPATLQGVVWLGRLLLIGGLLALWQVAPRWGLNEFWFSSPALIAARLWEWVQDGVLWRHVWATVAEMTLGFLIGTPVAVAVAFVLGSYRAVAEVAEPLLIALYNVPKLALAPLFILWFGIGMTPKVVLVALVTFFLVFINTYSGVRDVDRDLVNVVRIMGASAPELFVKVLLPSAIPWILTGVKISLPYALTGAVAGEMMVSREGLGHLVAHSALMIDMTGVYAALAVLMAIGVVVDVVLAGSRDTVTQRQSRDLLQT